MRERHGVETPPVARRRAGRSHRSIAQQRLWFFDQLEPGSTVYNLPAAVRATAARLDVADA